METLDDFDAELSMITPRSRALQIYILAASVLKATTEIDALLNDYVDILEPKTAIWHCVFNEACASLLGHLGTESTEPGPLAALLSRRVDRAMVDGVYCMYSHVFSPRSALLGGVV